MKKIIILSLIFLVLLFPNVTNASDEFYGLSQQDYIDKSNELLTKLLDQTYKSYTIPNEFDTSDLVMNNDNTNLYLSHSKWFANTLIARNNKWEDYNYTLEFNKIENNYVHFILNIEYSEKESYFYSEENNIDFIIKLNNINDKYYIDYISTNGLNIDIFELIYKEELLKNSKLSLEEYTEKRIQDSIKIFETTKQIKMSAVSSDTINMEKNYKEFNNKMGYENDGLLKLKEGLTLETINYENNIVKKDNDYSVLSINSNYNGEVGRNYADKYHNNRNTSFYYSSGTDCTNFVSQCIWAAYGAWNPNMSLSQMNSNISNKVRMVNGTYSSGWFAGAGGGSGPWESVDSLWNYSTAFNSKGPRAYGYNNNAIYSNISPGQITTGQVLQLRIPSGSRYSHSVYVSGGVNNDYSNIMITQHSSSTSRTNLQRIIDSWGNNVYMRRLSYVSGTFDR